MINKERKIQMLQEKVNVKKLKDDAVIPTYGSEYAAGADLYACIEECITIEPGETCLVKTGIAMEIPVGYAGLIYARSGLATKKGLAPANKVGVIDADFYNNEDNEGHFSVKLINHGEKDFEVKVGDRIVQGIFAKYLTTSDDKCEKVRKGGIGSTNKEEK